MLRVSNSVLVAGGAVLGAGLMLLANPKAVHAVAAALVQVTNTSSNPVVTQGISQEAAGIVEVQCGGIQEECNQLLPNSTEVASLYTVPAGQSLVITSADVSVSITSTVGCDGYSEAELIGMVGPLKRWFIAAGTGSQHFTYPAGIVVAPGSPLSTELTSGGHDCELALQLHGYLTTN